MAPTDPLPVVGVDPNDQKRGLDVVCQGLVPFWAKDI